MRLAAVLALLVAAPAALAAPAAPEALRAEVVRSFPHDPAAFTQGLEWDGRVLYESTGLYGRSSVRVVDRATGRVVRARALPPSRFGEGLTRVGNRLVQLTWRERVAYVWSRDRLAPVRRLPVAGEGWGVCFDGRRLVQSDGTSTLRFRDPQTLRVRRRVEVTVAGPERALAGLPPGPVRLLNELECVGRDVYANVWKSDLVLRIDPASGRVSAVIDASGLLTPAEREGADVLNGIAHDPARGTLLLTGKLWPRLFEVRLVPR